MKTSLILIATLLISGVPVMANWVAYNDCVFMSFTPNVTTYSGYLGGGGGFETPSGLLKDFDTGDYTSVTAGLTAVNVSGGTGVMPNTDTPAYSVFNGIIDLGGSASYGDSTYPWSYDVTFTGLNPTKTYEFVTTANRGSSYSPERWTQFSIIGADTYANASSAGVVEVSTDVLKLNSGSNTVAGDIIQWISITAADGSFTVRSQNNPDALKPYGYGLQAFRLTEIPEPTTLLLLGLGGLLLRKRIAQ